MVRTRTKKLRGGHYGRGWKAGRGKGKRGGSGMSGLGKHRWVWLLKYDRDHFGGKGFTSHHQAKVEVPITLSELSENLPSLMTSGFAKMNKDEVEVDLTSAGYDKLLGSGEFRYRGKIRVHRATEKALSKLSANGVTVETDAGSSEE
ncbi:MAG: uL15 family ribosomal protein [Thermoplasmataceae archaeon]